MSSGESNAAQLARLVNEVALLVENQQYDVAEQKARALYVRYTVQPDSEKDGMQAQFRRIEQLIDLIQAWKQEAGQDPHGQLLQVPVTFANPSDGQECTR